MQGRVAPTERKAAEQHVSERFQGRIEWNGCPALQVECWTSYCLSLGQGTKGSPTTSACTE